MLVNTGGLQFFGTVPNTIWTRLASIATIGSTSITVKDDITGWAVGN